MTIMMMLRTLPCFKYNKYKMENSNASENYIIDIMNTLHLEGNAPQIFLYLLYFLSFRIYVASTRFTLLANRCVCVCVCVYTSLIRFKIFILKRCILLLQLYTTAPSSKAKHIMTLLK